MESAKKFFGENGKYRYERWMSGTETTGRSERKHSGVRDKINSVQNGLGYRVVDEGEEVS